MISACSNICPIFYIILNSENMLYTHLFTFPLNHDRRVLVVVLFAQWTEGVVPASISLSSLLLIFDLFDKLHLVVQMS